MSEELEASDILRAARVNPLGNPILLNAQLRGDAGKVPFQIRVADGKISYEFKDPEQALILELGDEDSKLSERIGGKTSTVRPAKFDVEVKGMPVTYEDLALRFLYWPRPKLLGEETMRTRKAWKMEIRAPKGDDSQYDLVRLWLDKESGAILRIEGCDVKGRKLRQFEVISAQKLDGQWMLKSMRIERYNPDTGKTVGKRAYLEVLGKE